MRRATGMWIVVLFICAGVCFQGAAGPLNPPPGPIASTPGPEPRIAINATNTPGTGTALFLITEPGSYYLTDNITGVSGKSGIVITSSGVTIDLNGFEVAGVPGSANGIGVAIGGLARLRVQNGAVRDWGSNGIAIGSTSNGVSSVVEDVVVSGCALIGIRLGNNATVSRCTVLNCAGTGIRTDDTSVIVHCTVRGNGTGILTGVASSISYCTAEANTQTGIQSTGETVFSHCVAARNGVDGFTTGPRALISNCEAIGNTGDGIRSTSASVITMNLCQGNGAGAGDGAGIHVLSIGGSRIEGNNCLDNDRGIDVDSAANIIIRNTCADNGANWAIAANNIYGQIVDRTVPASPAVSVDAAASTLGSTDPHANFSY